MASPRYEGSPEPPSLRVQRLESSGAADAESVVMVKLTDEIFSALIAASKKSHAKLQLRVDKKGGVFDLGSLGVFRFQSQVLNGETDTLMEDSISQKYRMSGSFRTKYQIQATDKSFADTKEKAQKLLEEEKSRGAKEATSRLTKTVAPRIGAASSSRNPSPRLSRIDPISKISPNKVSNTTGSNGLSNGSIRQNVDPLAGELRKKKLRQRVLHLIVTGKFTSIDDVMNQIRKEGINEDDGWVRKAEEIVHDVSETRSSGRLILKPSCYPEVDSRWPWFSREEKEAVRRLLSSSSSKPQVNSAAFAPMRKTGIERMQAPLHVTNVSPEAIPTPPASRPGSGDGGATKLKPTSPPRRTSPELSPSRTSDLSSYTLPNGTKRTAHVPNAQNAKRPRQESASPPEDPTISITATYPPSKTKVPVASRSGGSSGSSRLSSPCSLSSPQNPSCDWEKRFPEIKTITEAEKYFNLFHSEYPTYMECFRQLHQVAQEFRELDEKLKKASSSKNSKETSEIEREIQKRFARFEKNDSFLKSRQVHADLRSKLMVLKQRISDWERSQDANAV